MYKVNKSGRGWEVWALRELQKTFLLKEKLGKGETKNT